MKLIDNVTLAGGTVTPGNRDPEEGYEAVESDYSVHLMSKPASYSAANLNLNGFELTAARGIFVESSAPNTGTDYSRILAQSSILNVGGDIVLTSQTRPAGNLNEAEELVETRNVGIMGDEDTVVNLRGSFITDVRSLADVDGLHLSTVNLLDGTAQKPNTFEVGADPADEVEAGTYAIGILNVGSVTDAGFVRLVNDHINDGDADNPEKTGAGEVLLAGSLTIAADSLLNAGGQGVKIAESLSIDATATLDLNHATPLEIGNLVPNFVGVGDQVDEWNEFRVSVTDSSNPGLGFKAVLDDGNTYWMAVAGNATLLLIR